MPRMLVGIAIASCCVAVAIAQGGAVNEAARLQQMAARFAPTEITVDLTKLSAADRKVLAKLVEASKIMDALFLRQVWAGNEAMLIDLAQDQTPEGRALLREAAALATEPTLKSFLTKRADAFVSNDYYASDVAWMELKGAVEPTIGPYEVYEDEHFNYKAAFESFITVQDEEESAKLQKFSGQLQDIENHLPIDPKYRNPKLGALSPIVVVNEIFCAGDANHGVQTAAFNLPNDEKVVREKGSKRVMLKNVQDAKFAKTLAPISQLVLSPNERKNLS